MPECPRYEGCDCPICPEQPNTIDGGVWYPGDGDPVCPLRKYARLPWVKTQRRIAKLKLGDVGYFSVRMLSEVRRATKGLVGADPDTPGSEDRWLEKRRSKERTMAGKAKTDLEAYVSGR